MGFGGEGVVFEGFVEGVEDLSETSRVIGRREGGGGVGGWVK